MRPRRSLLRGVAAVAAGGTLTGLFGTGSASAPAPNALYDTDLAAGADTTIAARVDPALRARVGLPPPAERHWANFRERHPSLDAAQFGPVSASVAVEAGRIVGGCAIADGAFDSETLKTELVARGAEQFGDTPTAGGGGFERFTHAPSSYAAAVGGSRVVLGYGRGVDEALAHVDASIERGAYRSPGSVADESAAELTGDAVSYATLGGETRSRLLDRLDGSSGVEAVVRDAEALGVALSVGDRRSHVQYGVAADPGALSARELWDLTTQVSGREESLDIESVSRHGRMIVVEAAVETADLWSAHGRVIGSIAG